MPQRKAGRKVAADFNRAPLSREVAAKQHLVSVIHSLPEKGGALYRELLKIEEHFGVDKEYLVRFVRRKSSGRWARDPVNTDAEDGAFHCWLVDEEGVIEDPHFKAYEEAMLMPNCDANQKVYSEWTEEEQRTKLFNLLPGMIARFKENGDRLGWSVAATMKFHSEHPRELCCPMNAWAIKAQNPKRWTIKIGNLGFRSKDNHRKIWWEY